MAKILIITKNPLAEQALQLALQKINDEVFCSSSLLEQVDFYPEVVGYFSIAIVSDTISSLELSKHLDTLKQKDLLLIRKGNSEQLKGTDLEWMLPHIDGWVTDLSQAKGGQLSREKLCQEIWGTGMNTSNVCQLSFLVSCIREKMVHVGFDEKELKTMWGRGYQLGDMLVSLLDKNDFSIIS